MADPDPQDVRTAAAVLDAGEWQEYITAWFAAAEERGRAEGRQWAIDTLRAELKDQGSWLWFEVGETALTKVIARLEAVAPGGTDG